MNPTFSFHANLSISSSRRSICLWVTFAGTLSTLLCDYLNFIFLHPGTSNGNDLLTDIRRDKCIYDPDQTFKALNTIEHCASVFIRLRVYTPSSTRSSTRPSTFSSTFSFTYTDECPIVLWISKHLLRIISFYNHCQIIFITITSVIDRDY